MTRKFYDSEIYYDKNNKIITYEEYDKLRDDLAYKVIKQTNINKFFISTVWLGYSIDNMLEIPQIFETMIFDEEVGIDIHDLHYTTEKEALAGHEKAVKWVKEARIDMWNRLCISKEEALKQWPEAPP